MVPSHSRWQETNSLPPEPCHRWVECPHAMAGAFPKSEQSFERKNEEGITEPFMTVKSHTSSLLPYFHFQKQVTESIHTEGEKN